MARLASQQVAGYFKTPRHITAMIANHFVNPSTEYTVHNLFDPCAGKGEALIDLTKAIFPYNWNAYTRKAVPKLYSCELEGERHEELENQVYALRQDRSDALNGDAFNISFRDGGVNVLFLNPPYEQLKGERLETKFLRRFLPTLIPDRGILVYIVPHYALGDAAELIAEELNDVRCYRFPDDDFKAFKQVVLFGRRRLNASALVNNITINWLKKASADASILPVLDGEPDAELKYVIMGRERFDIEMTKIDLKSIEEHYCPFMIGSDDKMQVAHGIDLGKNIDEMIGAVYPVIVTPRPTHVATALASGLINGAIVEPDKKSGDFPPIMVKGVFNKELRKLSEKTDKDGVLTSEMMVEQPQLGVTILDMKKWTYHDLKIGHEPTGAEKFSEMNIADLLTHYGMALTDVMYKNCPPLHEVGTEIELPQLGLTPFHIQNETINAALKVLFTDHPDFVGVHPFIDGEVGTGKTLVSLVVANMLTPENFEDTKRKLAAVGISGGRIQPIRNVLVMCPPHLIHGWSDECAKILPDARVVVLERVEDVNEALELPPHDVGGIGGQLTVFLMSREMAKLGHAWRSGLWKSTCPGCGKVHDKSENQLVSNRLRCERVTVRPTNKWANLAISYAHRLARIKPDNENVDALLSGRYSRRMLDKIEDDISMPDFDEDAAWESICEVDKPYAKGFIGRLVLHTAREIESKIKMGQFKECSDLLYIIKAAFMVANHPERDEAIAAVVSHLFPLMVDGSSYSDLSRMRERLAEMLYLIYTPGSEIQIETFKDLKARFPKDGDWRDHAHNVKHLMSDRETGFSYSYSRTDIRADNDNIRITGYGRDSLKLGDSGVGFRLLEMMLELATFEESEKCNTALYGGIAEPRRFPLATYITRRHPELFDFLILDEAHEYNNNGTAQEKAAHRLTELGKPTMVLTGTSNNGYAKSLFMNMWALSPKFRAEYDRDQIMDFVNRYGYRKVLVEHNEKKSKRRSYGSMSDRHDDDEMDVTMRKAGPAPGVLPLFILRHFLPVAIPMHKADLDVDLPPKVEVGEALTADDKLMEEYGTIESDLMEQIFEDINDDDLAGKLWGQMVHLPTMLDRAHEDTGNAQLKDGRHRYEIRYPENVGGHLVTAAKPLPASELTEKERWMIENMEREFAENRPVLLFVWNTGGNLPMRLKGLIEGKFGKNTVAIMDTKRVKAIKRQGWIAKNVVNKKRKVMIVNPTAVETGLNNLTYFPTAIWFQPLPSCSSITYDQANGRIHRPGQMADEVRIYMPYFELTGQEAQYYLLGEKVLASRQVDGLDTSSALLSAGANKSDLINTMAVGQAIYELIKKRKGNQREKTKFGTNGHSRPVKEVVKSNGTAKRERMQNRNEALRQPALIKDASDGEFFQLSLF